MLVRIMSRQTRILLVDASRSLDQSEREVYDVHHPPVGLLSLATYINHSRMGPCTEVKLVDSTMDYSSLEELRDIMLAFEPDIVGLRCLHLHTSLFHAATEMAKDLPFPVLTIGGGPYPSAAPTPTLEKDPHLDIVVIGEGEAIFLDLVEAFHESGDLTSVAGIQYRGASGVESSLPRGVIQDLDTVPFPDWTLIDLHRYGDIMGQAPVLRPTAPVVTSRGCPYACTYCHELFQKRFRVRSPKHLVEELVVLSDLGVHDISIIDDIFNLYPERVIEIFNLIAQKNLKLNFYYPNGLRGDRMTHEVIDAMVEGGSVLFTYALESGSARIQKFMKKRLRFEPFYDAVDYTIKKGVMVDMFLMVGFPTETVEEARKTLDFLMQWEEVCFPYVNVLNYFPGTEIYDYAVEQGHSESELQHYRAGAHSSLGLETDVIQTLKTEFLRRYFLRRSRLDRVIPIQRKYLSEDEILRKYKAYLPMDHDHIHSVDALIDEVAMDTQPPKRVWSP
jgi:radical SAM superfamily enzyme YgiQ (UPF0313 family)